MFCAGNELFFVCLYLMDFYKRPLWLDIEPLLFLFPSALKASPWISYIVKRRLSSAGPDRGHHHLPHLRC